MSVIPEGQPSQCCVCKSFYDRDSLAVIATPEPLPSPVSHGYCAGCLPAFERECEEFLALDKSRFDHHDETI